MLYLKSSGKVCFQMLPVYDRAGLISMRHYPPHVQPGFSAVSLLGSRRQPYGLQHACGSHVLCCVEYFTVWSQKVDIDSAFAAHRHR